MKWPTALLDQLGEFNDQFLIPEYTDIQSFSMLTAIQLPCLFRHSFSQAVQEYSPKEVIDDVTICSRYVLAFLKASKAAS